MATYRGTHSEKMRVYYAAYRKAHPERAYHKVHPEKSRAKSAAYRKAHPEKNHARKAAWAKAHPGQYRARNAAWVRNHPQATKAIMARSRFRRRAAIKSALCNLTHKQWEEIRRRQGHRCLACGEKKPLTQDHIIPVSRGGVHTASNIQGLCLSCNSKKHDKTIDYRSNHVESQLILWGITEG
jgi:5-methylcytosine-specific restriction endonuclease McrA